MRYAPSMFSGITAATIADSGFKEDSVRELIILPILNRLGYSAVSDPKVVRSKTLKHPFIRVGTRNQPVSLIPDYTLLKGDKAIFVLDAKAPGEDVLDGKHVEQVYSYAVHPEIKCREFGLCNGKRLVVFNVDKPEPILDISFADLEAKWAEIEKVLSARFLLRPELRNFSPDFGFKLKRMGITSDIDLVFVGVRLNMFAKVADDLFTAMANCKLGDGDGEHCVSYDFDPRFLPEIVDGLPKQLQDRFCDALKRYPFKAAAGLVIEIDVSVRLGQETQSKTESFIPLVINKVLASRFNPAEVAGDPQDVPDDIFQLRRQFVIKRPQEKSEKA